jgi:hypothetical protein
MLRMKILLFSKKERLKLIKESKNKLENLNEFYFKTT